MLNPMFVLDLLRELDKGTQYLFIFFYFKGLSALLDSAIHEGATLGYKICQISLVISHLLFADDSIVFCNVNRHEAMTVCDVLELYELASGQPVHITKSTTMFTKGTGAARQDELLITLDV